LCRTIAILKTLTKLHNFMKAAAQSKLQLNRTVRLLLLVAIGTTLLLLQLLQQQPNLRNWTEWADACYNTLHSHPSALVCAIAVLPGLGVPISPLLILLGIFFGPIYGLPMTCLIAIGAQTVCTSWTYLMASGPLRRLLHKFILRQRILPILTDSNALQLGFMIRITPGMPYFMQNLALGIMGLKFKSYLLVSIPITSIYTIGFVVTGGAIFQGKIELILAGLFLIVILIFMTRIRLKRNKLDAE